MKRSIITALAAVLALTGCSSDLEKTYQENKELYPIEVEYAEWMLDTQFSPIELQPLCEVYEEYPQVAGEIISATLRDNLEWTSNKVWEETSQYLMDQRC